MSIQGAQMKEVRYRCGLGEGINVCSCTLVQESVCSYVHMYTLLVRCVFTLPNPLDPILKTNGFLIFHTTDHL
jgi:hypothetical protein